MKFMIYAALFLGLLLGFGCVNYTKAFGVELHYEFATKTGLPGTSPLIYWADIALLIVSSCILGFLWGRRSRRRAQDNDNTT